MCISMKDASEADLTSLAEQFALDGAAEDRGVTDPDANRRAAGRDG